MKLLKYQMLNIYNGGPWIGPLAILKMKTGKRIDINEIVSLLRKNEENIVLTGGEPLCHPDILGIIDKVLEYDYKRILIRTSAEQFSDLKLVRDLIKRNVTMFEVIPYIKNKKSIKHLRNIHRITERYAKLKVTYFAVMISIDNSNYMNLTDILKTIFYYVNVTRIIFCWGDPTFNIWQAGEHLKEAIDYSINNNVWAFTRGIPACVVPEKIRHLEELFTSRYNSSKIKLSESCNTCEFTRICNCIPQINDNYMWQPKPLQNHVYSKYVNDIISNGFIFNDDNMEMYSS